MKLLTALVVAGLVWLGFQYRDAMNEIENMKRIDQDLVEHSVIPYNPIKWRD